MQEEHFPFAMIIDVNLLIALTTPPMGNGLFIMTGVANVKFEDLVKEFLPFYVPLLATLFLVTCLPSLTLFFPNLLMGK